MKNFIYKSFDAAMLQNQYSLFQGDAYKLLASMPEQEILDLIVTSPPYNIGKEYEKIINLDDYFQGQQKIITEISSRLKNTGSICWQVGNYISKQDEIFPLDFGFHEIFSQLGFKLKNRIVWTFGHGQHSKKRFSGRYEVILWYVKTEDYKWDLDAVRVPQLYPGKKAYQGPKKGTLSGNPKGKNPEDVWNIPNVKGNHVEKTIHPCQFPVALVQRLVKALTEKDDLVFDPFMGVASAGVAALLNNRKFLGADLDSSYVEEASKRLKRTLIGDEKIREDKPIYNPSQSNLSKVPLGFTKNNE